MHVHDPNAGYKKEKCHKGDTDIMGGQFMGIIISRNCSGKASSEKFFLRLKNDLTNMLLLFTYFSQLLHKFFEGERHCFVHISVFVFLSNT